MALTLKKKSESGALEVPPWHPNLRIVEGLPDTKVVRTAFFVNVFCGVLAIGLALYFGYQEWKLHEINSQIADLDRQIQQGSKQSREAVALYKDFKLEAAKTDEVADFVNSKPTVSNIILRLGTIAPKKIALDALEFKENGITIRATIKGAPDRASHDATAYEKQLKADPALGPMFSEVNTLTIVRNTSTGRLRVELFCAYKKDKKS